MIRVYEGHCGTVMARLSGRFALAYLDPPFRTGRVYRMPDGTIAFDDRWPSREAYLERLQSALISARDLLIPEGSLVLHLDPREAPHARLLLDSVFGEECFASEIVWCYRRWPSKTTNFQRVHDVLLRYRKDPSATPRWNQLYEPLSPKTLKTWGTLKQKAVWVPASGKADKPQRDRRRSSKTDEQSPGVPLGDVWDIGVIAGFAKERTGYPTQKPEALLERLVLSLTNPGDAVLDPFCGSGTTLAVCARHGRDAVGIDSSAAAVRIARARIRNLAGADRRPRDLKTTAPDAP